MRLRCGSLVMHMMKRLTFSLTKNLQGSNTNIVFCFAALMSISWRSAIYLGLIYNAVFEWIIIHKIYRTICAAIVDEDKLSGIKNTTDKKGTWDTSSSNIATPNKNYLFTISIFLSTWPNDEGYKTAMMPRFFIDSFFSSVLASICVLASKYMCLVYDMWIICDQGFSIA